MENLSKVEFNSQITKPTPNPISGKITSLSYHGNSNNIVEIKIKDNSDNRFVLTAYSNVNLDFSTVKIANLNDFGFRLQEAFNNQCSVSVFCQEDKIVSLEITSEIFSKETFGVLAGRVGRPGNGGSGGTGGGG